MTTQDVLRLRLHNQHLTSAKFKTPQEAVAWFGAVQSQDYSSAKWAIGQRIDNATDESIEKAFTEGKILRTHVMRPTWHFVAPTDIRWILKLTSPRVTRFMSTYNKRLELTDEVFKKAQKEIITSLQGKKQLTRQELKTNLTRIGITTNVQRLAHIVMQAELDGIACSGPRRGKQFTYMLLEERVAAIKTLNRDEALKELVKRYFTSHGPATVKDFVWWSGLMTADAKRGIEMNKNHLVRQDMEEKTYWFSETNPSPVSNKVYLLPNYDEYGIAYKDRDAFFNPDNAKYLDLRGNALFQHMIVVNGQINGMWKKILKKDCITIEFWFFRKPSNSEYHAFTKTTQELGKFLSLKVILKGE